MGLYRRSLKSEKKVLSLFFYRFEYSLGIVSVKGYSLVTNLEYAAVVLIIFWVLGL